MANTLTAAQFIKSGYLSDGFVFSKDEDAAASDQSADSSLPEQRKMENAARVALALTRLIADADAHSLSPNVQLDDFLIDFDEIDLGSEKIVMLQNIGYYLKPPMLSSQVISSSTLASVGEASTGSLVTSSTPALAGEVTIASTIQTLCRLLYSIFSQGDACPFFSSDGSTVTTDISTWPTHGPPAPVYSNFSIRGGESDVDSSIYSRSTQRSRLREVSIFSQLLESTNSFPVSICRLLADMMIGCDASLHTFEHSDSGGEYSPIASYAEVIEDLESMISDPHILLHDSVGGVSAPVFGRNMTYCREEEISLMMGIVNRMEQRESCTDVDDVKRHQKGVQAVFIAGSAGSGKSHLAHHVGEMVSKHPGWMTVKAKFDRSKVFDGSSIASSMFDQVIQHLIWLKQEGSQADIMYCNRASQAFVKAVGPDMLSAMVGFLPSLPSFIDGIDTTSQKPPGCERINLVYPLTKLLEAVVLDQDRFLMIVADDLQWTCKAAIDLISEVLVNLGSSSANSCRCLFVGLYRSDELESHPHFAVQHSMLCLSSCINATEIKISSFSKENVEDMIMAVLKLPRRKIHGLVDLVYKKTIGHVFFVCELMNKLLNDQVVVFSSLTQSYVWDPENLDMIQMGKNVAELIASNLSSLPNDLQLNLTILSCFGSQTDDSLLNILERYRPGIEASIDIFVEKGILEKAGGICIFAHDLIQQAAYENMAIPERLRLHLELGQFMGDITNDCHKEGTDLSQRSKCHTSLMEGILKGMHHLEISGRPFFVGNFGITSSLTSLACDQINAKGVEELIGDDQNQRRKFAQWNNDAGKKASKELNFQAMFHYYSKGIAILAGNEGYWKSDISLCVELYEGSVTAAHALREYSTVVEYANALEENAPFEHSLGVQVPLLQSLGLSGLYEEAHAQGLKIAARFGIDVRVAADDKMKADAFQTTDEMATNSGIAQIAHNCNDDGDATERHTMEILLWFSQYLTLDYGSPLHVIVTCAVVQRALKRIVACAETAGMFAIYAMMKSAYSRPRDFAGGKLFLDAGKAILDQCGIGAEFTETAADYWFSPLGAVGRRLHVMSDKTMQFGMTDLSITCVVQAMTARLLGGEQLSSLLLPVSSVQSLLKQSVYYVPWIVCNCVVLGELTGVSDDVFSLVDDSISSLDDLQSAGGSFFLHDFHVYKMLLAYWRGDFAAAELHSRQAALARENMIFCLKLHHIYYGALVSFQVGGAEQVEAGKEMLDEIEKLADISMDTFGHKLLLLRAEYSRSTGGISDETEHLYKASIKAAQDHGNIHEAAIGYELLGKYYSLYGSLDDADECYTKAVMYFTQWGAVAVAKRIAREQMLDTHLKTDSKLVGTLKRPADDNEDSS